MLVAVPMTVLVAGTLDRRQHGDRFVHGKPAHLQQVDDDGTDLRQHDTFISAVVHGLLLDAKGPARHVRATLASYKVDVVFEMVGGWLMLGKAYEAIGQRTMAADAFRKATEIAPGNAEAVEGYMRTRG